MEAVDWQHGFIHKVGTEIVPIFDIWVKDRLVFRQEVKKGSMWDVLVLDVVPASVIYHRSCERGRE